jgi:hypothetical protein
VPKAGKVEEGDVLARMRALAAERKRKQEADAARAAGEDAVAENHRAVAGEQAAGTLSPLSAPSLDQIGSPASSGRETVESAVATGGEG